jgi:hypothetical protein
MPSADCPIVIPLHFNVAVTLMNEGSHYSCIFIIINTKAASNLFWQRPGFGPMLIDVWWTEWGWDGVSSEYWSFLRIIPLYTLHSCLIHVPSVLRSLVFTFESLKKKTLLCLSVCLLHIYTQTHTQCHNIQFGHPVCKGPDCFLWSR